MVVIWLVQSRDCFWGGIVCAVDVGAVRFLNSFKATTQSFTWTYYRWDIAAAKAEIKEDPNKKNFCGDKLIIKTMNTKKFTILHSNDMHGDFLAEVQEAFPLM